MVIGPLVQLLSSGQLPLCFSGSWLVIYYTLSLFSVGKQKKKLKQREKDLKWTLRI
jgi:hypothetical protein